MMIKVGETKVCMDFKDGGYKGSFVVLNPKLETPTTDKTILTKDLITSLELAIGVIVEQILDNQCDKGEKSGNNN